MSEALFIDLAEFSYNRIDLVEIMRQISVENIYDVMSTILCHSSAAVLRNIFLRGVSFYK